MQQQDLVVIGGGAGGLVVTSIAARLGLRVTLIEKEPQLGGDCLHHGCVPSKALIRAAKVASLMRRAGEFGLAAQAPRVDLGRVNDSVHEVIARIQPHDDPERFRGYGASVLFGAAQFVDPRTVRVDGQTIAARRFVIATGSRPFVPPVPGLAEAGYLTNLDLFDLRELPTRLVVLGGGPIGMEMAQAFARLGSRVTVVQRAPQILPREDAELSVALHEVLAREGVRICLATELARVRLSGGVKTLECTGPKGESFELEAEQILVAVGRRPNVENLGLEAAGVAHDARGVGVDARLRTRQKHIYACGDVCGPYQFTHMAEYQAGIVISNAVFRVPRKVDYRIVPWVTFCDPELARVGMTEAEAREAGYTPTVLRFALSEVDRALTDRESAGMVKLVVQRGRILGAGVLAEHAGELLHEIVLAMQAGARVRDIASAIHAYPTLSQAHRRAANSYYAGKLLSPFTQRLAQWLTRL